jgi:metal-sulfur cluster biosynthetic enzyme
MGDDDAMVMERLRQVVDPELGVNIVDLGLVYHCGLDDDVARVLLTTTTPACPIGSYLEQAIRWALCDLPGVTDVEVELTHEPPWTAALMSPAARQALGMPA